MVTRSIRRKACGCRALVVLHPDYTKTVAGYLSKCEEVEDLTCALAGWETDKDAARILLALQSHVLSA